MQILIYLANYFSFTCIYGKNIFFGGSHYMNYPKRNIKLHSNKTMWLATFFDFMTGAVKNHKAIEKKKKKNLIYSTGIWMNVCYDLWNLNKRFSTNWIFTRNFFVSRFLYILYWEKKIVSRAVEGDYSVLILTVFIYKFGEILHNIIYPQYNARIK